MIMKLKLKMNIIDQFLVKLLTINKFNKIFIQTQETSKRYF